MKWYKGKEMKKYLLVIKGDMNDADYTMEKTEIKEGEIIELDEGRKVDVLELVKKCAKAIKECKGSENWPTSQYSDSSVEDIYEGILTEEETDLFHEYVPHGECGIHKINSIDLYEIVGKTKLL